MSDGEYRPYSGSCPVCRAALGLASVRRGGTWYCSPGCAEGRPGRDDRPPAVDEAWLTNRPRRFYKKRKPKELRAAPSESLPWAQ